MIAVKMQLFWMKLKLNEPKIDRINILASSTYLQMSVY